MKLRYALPAILLAVAGCDDTDVQNKVADVLQYGSVASSLTCNITPDGGSNTCNSQARVLVKYFADGTSFVQCSPAAGSRVFSSMNERNTPISATDLTGGPSTGIITCLVSAGNVTITDTGYNNCTRTVSVETYCAGRNLEAFGVEP